MSSIDERVVSMKFNNTQFQTGVKDTLTSLDKLKQGLKLEDASAGMRNLPLQAIAAGVDHISSRFSAMSAIAVGALMNIGKRATDAGIQLVKSFTIDPISTGLAEYEQTLNATRTVMSGTGESVEQVTKTLEDLNAYSDKTVYSFSDMTNNIKHFTNAGLSSAKAADTMKGIANAAAAAGAGADGAARAMLGFGQSMSMGFIGLQDWNQIDGSGVATKEFKNELINAGLAAGTLTKSLDGTVRTSKGTEVTFQNLRTTLQDQWATSEILVDTLNKYSDTSTEVGKKAEKNATQVSTLTQMMGVLKESVGSGWSESWKSIFGNLEEATTLWTSVNKVIGDDFLGAMSKSRNEMLKTWKDLGGRTDLLEGLKNIFNAIVSVLKPIKEAFREIFPAKTGADLANFTKAFRDFTEKLKMGAETSEGFKSTFKGIFAIFSIVGKVIGGVVKFITTFFSLLATGSGSIWTLTGSIGDLVVKFNDWLEKGKYIETFFENMAKWRAAIIKPLIDFVSRLVHAIGTLVSGDFNGFIDELIGSLKAFIPMGEAVEAKFTKIATAIKAIFDLVVRGDFTSGFRKSFGIDEDDAIVDKILSIRDAIRGLPEFFNGLFGKDTGAKNAASGIDALNVSLVRARGLGESVRAWWQEMAREFQVFKKWLSQLGEDMAPGIDSVREKFAEFFGDMGLQEGLALLNTGFFMAFYAMMRKFLKNVNGLVDSLKGSFDSIGGVLDQVTSNLKTMQTSVRADIILKIGASLLLLATAIFILSKIDPAKLGIALGAMAIMLGELIGALVLLEKYTTTKGAVKMNILSTSLILLGTALLLMAAAIAIFGSMDLVTLAKGLGTVAIVLGLLVGAVKLLEMSGGDKAMMKAATGLLILSVALMALAGAIKLFSAMEPDTLLQGGWKIAAILTVFVLMLRAMPPEGQMMKAAGAILIISLSMIVLYGALKLFSSMSGEEMGKSLVMLAASLIILVTALNTAQTAVRGAAAILLIAAALAVLAPVLMLFGSMEWESIAKSLVFMTGLLALLVLLGAVGSAGVVVLMGLGQAILLLGVAALAAGAGLLFFSMGLTALAVSGAAGTAALVATVIAVAQTIPLIAQQIGLGIIAIAVVIAQSGPQIVAALFVVIGSLLQAITDSLPKIAALINHLVSLILNILVANIPKMVNAGMQIILGILRGIANNIGKIVTVAGQIITNFLNALAKQLPQIIQAGVNLIVSFVEGLAKAIRSNQARMNTAGMDLARAIVEGMVNGIRNGITAVVNAARNLASSALDAAMNFLGIRSPSREFMKIGEYSGKGMAIGFENMAGAVGKASESVGHEAIDAMRKSISGISSLIDSDIDMTPVIAPILDLSDIKKNASQIDKMLSTQPIATARAYAVASENSRLNRVGQEVQNGSSSEAPVAPITFNQFNSSPKALSSVEIYRQTRNQLSLAKGALTE